MPLGVHFGVGAQGCGSGKDTGKFQALLWRVWVPPSSGPSFRLLEGFGGFWRFWEKAEKRSKKGRFFVDFLMKKSLKIL